MKLLLKLGRGNQTKTVEATRIEQCAEVRRVFIPSDGQGIVEQKSAEVKSLYFLVYGEGLKRSVRAVGFEVIEEKKAKPERVDRARKT